MEVVEPYVGKAARDGICQRDRIARPQHHLLVTPRRDLQAAVLRLERSVEIQQLEGRLRDALEGRF